MRPTRVALFAAGYIIGARAGRERYAQIVEGMARASQRLDDFSSRRPPGFSARRPPGLQDQRSHDAHGDP